jgi:hypothetical protein
MKVVTITFTDGETVDYTEVIDAFISYDVFDIITDAGEFMIPINQIREAWTHEKIDELPEQVD